MYTRTQYLNGKCTHRQYYAQFVSVYAKQIVKMHYKENMVLNDWDHIGACINGLSISRKMKEVGDYTTKAGLVCIAKEACEQLKEKGSI